MDTKSDCVEYDSVRFTADGAAEMDRHRAVVFVPRGDIQLHGASSIEAARVIAADTADFDAFAGVVSLLRFAKGVPR